VELHEFAREKFETMPAEQVRPRLFVTGGELIAACYKPGEAFKEMLAFAEDAQLEGRIGSAEQGMALVREKFGGPR
jgi:poly(A) polymerase